MKNIFGLVCFLFYFNVHSFAQKQANIWYFGHHAGLDFSSGTPNILTDGQIYTDEGVASISDASGNLLFYTDGTKIWNRDHVVMSNGQDLNGTFTSSQSAIIVPKINDPSRYYVFTVDQLGFPNGLQYSIVNMDLAGGLGDVELKNTQLVTPICEKLTAVKHCNGRDIWVIVHGWNSDAFYSYLITAAGITATPVVSHTGRLVSSSRVEYALGCMKASPNGKKLALAHSRLGLDLCDFDNSTGIVSNGQSMFLPAENYANMYGPYGVEFSANSKLLYVSGDYFDFTVIDQVSAVFQYDVSLTDISSIQASKHVVYVQQSYWSTDNFGSLQMAPDGKIYLAELGQQFLSVINRPDSVGIACQFVHGQQSISLPPAFFAASRYGLPTFIQSYWRPDFTFRGECSGSRIYFDHAKEQEVLSIKWDFGDPTSGLNNISTRDSTFHDFTADGLYSVKLIRYTTCGNDTTIKQVQAGKLQFALGNDTLICGNTGYLLDPSIAAGSGYDFLWQNGSTASTHMVNTSGLYWVEIRNKLNGCFKRDSISVSIQPNPQFSLGNDFTKCEDQPQTLSVSIPSATYLWSNGNTNSSGTIRQTGIYWVDVTLNGCTKRDSIRAIFYPYPVVKLGNDTTLCEGQNYILDASNVGLAHQWQNNSVSQTFNVTTPGTYWVNVTDHGCTSVDTIKIRYDLKPNFSFGNDTSICSGMTIDLKPSIQNGTALKYLWSNGSTADKISVTQQGLYSLQLTNNCGSKTDEILIKEGICKLYVPSGFTPNKDGLNDSFRASFGEDVTNFKMQVFGRWGQVVFETNDIRKGWDGSIKGIPQATGLYVWMIKYNTRTNPEERSMKGTVMLIR